jgi:hypothetical protein
LVRTEVFGSLDREQIRKARARAVDAALDRADRAPADVGRFLIGEAGGAHEDQRLALIRRKLRERGAEFLKFKAAALLGCDFKLSA